MYTERERVVGTRFDKTRQKWEKEGNKKRIMNDFTRKVTCSCHYPFLGQWFCRHVWHMWLLGQGQFWTFTKAQVQVHGCFCKIRERGRTRPRNLKDLWPRFATSICVDNNSGKSKTKLNLTNSVGGQNPERQAEEEEDYEMIKFFFNCWKISRWEGGGRRDDFVQVSSFLYK